MHDVIIIGAGPAGLAAALTLGRVRRDALVIDSGEPRNARSPEMHNFLTRDGTPPAELRAIARAQLQAYPTVRVREGRVGRVEGGPESGFQAHLENGEVIGARRLLLAAGVRDALPAIPGLSEHWGTSVLHCPYCHGYEVRDSPLAVLGATPPRVRLAIQLTRLSDDVVLCTNAEGPVEPSARTDLERRGVRIRDEPIADVTDEGAARIRIGFDGGPALVRRAIFVASSPSPSAAELAAQLGCTILEDGTIEVDELSRTSRTGVFAAGDMARRPGMPGPAAAVIAAAASGAMAGAMIDQDLLTDEFALPDPFAARQEV